MKTFLGIALFLLCATGLRADTVEIATSGMTVGGGMAPISIDFQWDATAGEVVPGSDTISFLGATFTLFSADGAIFDWFDTTGDLVQINPYAYIHPPTDAFPTAGVYDANYVIVACAGIGSDCSLATGAASYSHGNTGTLNVMAVPEPNSALLVGFGVIFAWLGSKRLRALHPCR